MTIYSELVVFKLDSPLPVPDIRVSGITCVPLWNIKDTSSTYTTVITHSPLTNAIEKLGTETVFANMMMELLDLLYPEEGTIFYQLVCLVEYEMAGGTQVEIAGIEPLFQADVRRISAFAQEGIYG